MMKSVSINKSDTAVKGTLNYKAAGIKWCCYYCENVEFCGTQVFMEFIVQLNNKF